MRNFNFMAGRLSSFPLLLAGVLAISFVAVESESNAQKPGGYGHHAHKHGNNKRGPCEKGHWHRCRGKHRRGTDAKKTRDGLRHGHGHKAKAWGNKSGSFCGGQGGCTGGTGSGYRGLASNLYQAASTLTGEIQKLQQTQQEIAQESVSDQPGPDSQDAQGFYQASDGGQSRYAKYEASDGVVQEQVELYNDLGDTIGELEEEANRYREQAAEMDRMAEKSENNTENLDTQNSPYSGSGNNLASGITDNKSAKLTSNPKAKEYDPKIKSSKDGDGLASSEFNDKTKSLSSISLQTDAQYPTKAVDKAGLIGGQNMSAASRGSLRDELRARFNQKYGREPSEGELNSLTSQAEKSGASARSVVNASKEGKPGDLPEAGSAEDAVAAFQGGLSGASVSLAGSETDASVKAMLEELNASDPNKSRGPASVQSSGIGAEDGPTLFERSHAAHKRCQKNGCVSQREGAERGEG